MAITLKLKRGLKSKLPTLAEGELGYTTDEKKIYIGTSSGNIELARLTDVLASGGTAVAATKWATGRTVGASGDATGTSGALDGTANVTIPLTLSASGVTPGTYTKITVDAKGRATVGAGAVKGDVGLGNVDNTADSAKNVASAAKWTNGRTVALTGGVTGSATVDGSANVSIATTQTANQSNQKVGVSKNSTTVTGTRKTLNFIDGANATVTVADDSTNDRVNITVAATNTTYGNATTSAAGLMSNTDKSKLDGIAAGANNYSHPNSGATAGTYNSVTVNAQGHVTAGTNQTNMPTATKLQTGRKIGSATFDGTVDITLAQIGALPANGPVTNILPISRAGSTMIEFENTAPGDEAFGSIQAVRNTIGMEVTDVATGNLRALRIREYKADPDPAHAFYTQESIGGVMKTWYGHHTGELIIAVGNLSIAVPELAVGAIYQAPIVTHGKLFPDVNNVYVGIQCTTLDWVRMGILPWALDVTTTGFKPSFKNLTNTTTAATTYYGRFFAVWSV